MTFFLSKPLLVDKFYEKLEKKRFYLVKGIMEVIAKMKS